MARIDAGQQTPTRTFAAFGCNCMSFRMRPPDIDTILKGAARAAQVQVRFLGVKDGVWQFEAWTNEEHYQVVFDPLSELPGGWCKHCAACAASVIGGWLKDLYTFIAEEHPEYTKKGKKKHGQESGVQDLTGADGTDTGPTGNYPPL